MLSRPATKAQRAVATLVLAAALVPSALLAWSYREMPHFGLPADDGVYWVSAKSLAAGDGYRILSFPGQPYQTKYPPLYPLLLSGVWRISPEFPANLRWATWFCWIFLPVLLVLCRQYFRGLGFSEWGAIAVCAACAVSWDVMFFSICMLSELPCLCLLLGCFAVTEVAMRWKRGFLAALAAGVLAGGAYLTRTATLPLLVAGPLYFALRRRFRFTALFTLGMAPFVIAWNFWVRTHACHARDPLSAAYTDYFQYYFSNFTWRAVPRVVFENLPGLFSSVGGLLVIQDGSFLGWLISSLVGLAAVVGTFLLARKHGLSAYHLFAVLYLLQIAVWPQGTGRHWERLMLLLLPLFLGGLVVLCESLFKSGFALFWLGLLLVIAASSARLPATVRESRAELAGNLQAYQWIRKNTDPDTRFLANLDTALYLYTGRLACRFMLPKGEGGYGHEDQNPRDYVLSYVRVHHLSYLVDSVFFGSAGFIDPNRQLRRVKVFGQTSIIELPR